MARDDFNKRLREGRAFSNQPKDLQKNGEVAQASRSKNAGRPSLAAELGGARGGSGTTTFNSTTNPELEQSLSAGGTNPGRSLRQDLSATRGRTEVGPAGDPGGGAGRIRPVSPTLSRRELEEQRRRGRHDASSARASLRSQIGAISGRGPTRSQQAALSSAPTAGEFTSQRVADITAASQPNAAESQAQEFGLRRLESDRGFALDSRDQQIDMRGQDTEERLGLRREETFRRGQDVRERNNIRDNTRRSKDDGRESSGLFPTREVTGEDGQTTEVVDWSAFTNAPDREQRRIADRVGSQVGAQLRQSGLLPETMSDGDVGQLAFSMMTNTASEIQGDSDQAQIYREVLPNDQAGIQRLVTAGLMVPQLGEEGDRPMSATSLPQVIDQLMEMEATEDNKWFFGGTTARVGGSKVDLSKAGGFAGTALAELRDTTKRAALATARHNPDKAKDTLLSFVDAEIEAAESGASQEFDREASGSFGPGGQRGLRSEDTGATVGRGQFAAEEGNVTRLQEARKALQAGEFEEFEKKYFGDFSDLEERSNRTLGN